MRRTNRCVPGAATCPCSEALLPEELCAVLQEKRYMKQHAPYLAGCMPE